MSAEASLPLQKAIVSRLRNDAVLSGLIAGRVFDRIPPDAVKPYISYGPSQLDPEYADGYEASSERIQLDGWSTDVGKVEVKKIGRAIRDSLSNAEFSLDENQRLILLQLEQERYLTDPDGLTQHAVLIFVAHTEPTV